MPLSAIRYYLSKSREYQRSTNLGNISVKTQGPTDSHNKEEYDSPPIRQQPQERHIPKTRPYRLQDMRYAITNNDAKSNHPPKRKGPLSHTDSDQARFPKAVLHRSLEAIPATELAIYDDEANCPIDRDGQDHQQDDAGQQPRLLERVWLADDARADDRVGHVGHGAAQRRFRAVEVLERAREEIGRVVAP